VTLPANVDIVRVRGYWFDQAGGGSGLSISFTPVLSNLLDSSEHAWIKLSPKTATPDASTAYFFVDLIASNDPDLTPSRWHVTPEGQTPFMIEVPYDSSVVDVGGGLMMKAIYLTAATVTGP